MNSETWLPVADGVFQRRYDPLDVSVVAIVGDTGVTVVDTRNNPAEADEIVADVLSAFAAPIVAVINTHAHYDHTFGNQRFVRAPGFAGVPIYGHQLIPRHYERFEAPRLEAAQADPAREPGKRWADVQLTPPTELIGGPVTIHPGGREIELVPIAPGHTDTDLAIFVPDAATWLLGDVIEQSGPPMFGSGSYPLGWPDALDELLERIDPGAVIVPGHGSPVDRAFVVRQSAQLRAVAELIRASHAAATPVADVVVPAALAELWPDGFMRSALEAGYAQLDESPGGA
ncbi:MBL fold metallo-hydrolase [Herbiconiux daphne]|uniref:MBL fold metallo-hydrolase n=1 Tax=Herbiconiux daphne TaxID=2970914 RepID=A0ABT2GXY4_9MICO|nr:MBL fold metallo-hydrolase [Herbiconiux daphne]MCS5732810.1 MBL fold metallo-hydrolase [Herbiconiux daphne]